MGSQEGVVKISAGQGQAFSVAGANLTWKARGQDVDGGFCLFEQRLEAGEGVPLHTHSYPESFYILQGEVEFSSGEQFEKLKCGPGDVVIAGPHVPHSFFNNGTATALLLSISVAAHQAFFDAVEAADKNEPFARMNPADAFARVVKIGAETDTNFKM
ncbi:cupin domain-containing protein [Oryzifoliimicrobium ureilyticus]|uniref:cupin domain-containing protein n=1 Tax=Oryzifoliimicrobium ureilyticus TaxID=3113724 RepID=UPI0030767E89